MSDVITATSNKWVFHTRDQMKRLALEKRDGSRAAGNSSNTVARSGVWGGWSVRLGAVAGAQAVPVHLAKAGRALLGALSPLLLEDVEASDLTSEI